MRNAEVPAQPFDILNQKRRGVLPQLSKRARPACAALIVDDDAVVRRVEEAPMRRRRARARAAVQKQDRGPARIAAFFPVHAVQRVELEHAGLVRLDFRIELAA